MINRKKYRHLFFDLDRTLWDFERNARAAFKDIFEEFSLEDRIPDETKLFEAYNFHNEVLWAEYRQGKISKDFLRIERFNRALQDLKIENPETAKAMGDRYLELAPTKTHLVPNCIETLEYLKNKYEMHIITNGFKEVQYLKLDNSGLRPYFNHIITSDKIQVQKPKPGIFEYALKCANAKKAESIMIGDDLFVDVLGAKAFGMDHVFYNTKDEVHLERILYEISSIDELISLL